VVYLDDERAGSQWIEDAKSLGALGRVAGDDDRKRRFKLHTGRPGR